MKMKYIKFLEDTKIASVRITKSKHTVGETEEKASRGKISPMQPQNQRKAKQQSKSKKRRLVGEKIIQ